MTTADSLSEDRRHAELALDGKRDPVCGMAVEPATAKHHSEHAGRTYYFCSSRCREKFEAGPARYVTPATPEPPRPSAAAEVLWTCPMHPQIVRKEPGN